MKKKFVCTVCGYIHEGEEAPAQCPQCKAPASKFKELVDTELTFVTEHVIGIAKDVDPEIKKGLQANFEGECTEVGMYLAMSRQADREGYPEIAEAFKRYAFEEADHASRFCELLGDMVWDTKTNLKKRMEAESGACSGKMDLAKMAKQQDLDAIHDTVHEMAKDEARHGRGFACTTVTSATSNQSLEKSPPFLLGEMEKSSVEVGFPVSRNSFCEGMCSIKFFYRIFLLKPNRFV
mgnify:CR=1 FL=1